jgi:MFS family permease
VTRLKLATGDTFRSLRHRNFRVFFIYQGVSFVGTWLQLMAQDLLVLHLTDSGVALGWLVAIQFAPTLVLGAWAGVVIDRYDRRKLMTLTTTVMMIAAGTLGLLVLLDVVQLWEVYLLAAMIGLANTFDNPLRRTLVNDLVPPESLVNAVALNSTLVTSARIIGPALAGLFISTIGIGWCFVVNGISFIAVLYGLQLLDWRSMAKHEPVPRAKGQLRDGLRYVRSVDDLRIPLLLMAVVGTLAFNQNVLLPLFAKRDLGGSDLTYTTLASFFGAGSLIGSLMLARRRTIDTAFLARQSLYLGIGWLLVSFSPNVAVAAVALVFTGYVAIGVLSGGNAILQLRASPEMRGRVLALFTVVFLGSTPIGGPIAGFIGQHYGAPAGILLQAVSAGLSGATVLWVTRPRRDRVASLELPTELAQPVESAA